MDWEAVATLLKKGSWYSEQLWAPFFLSAVQVEPSPIISDYSIHEWARSVYSQYLGEGEDLIQNVGDFQLKAFQAGTEIWNSQLMFLMKDSIPVVIWTKLK